MKMKKIAVIGVSCSGKTTLGTILAEILDSKAVDIDEIHWKPGWESTPTEVLLPRVMKALDCPKWIVSGNYSSLQDYIFSEADTVIWLDYSPFVITKRALSRSLRRALFRESCCNGNYETFRQTFFSKNSILWWILKTYKRRKIQYTKLMSDPDYEAMSFIRLTSPQDADDLFHSLKKDK